MREPTEKDKKLMRSKEEDVNGERHWGVKFNRKEILILKMHWDKIEKLENEVIQFNQINCYKRPTKFYKDFVIINEEKMNFCFKVYKKTLTLNNYKMK